MFPEDFRAQLEREADIADLARPAHMAEESDDDEEDVPVARADDEKKAAIPTWPGKMREKISDKIATAMHGEKQKKLPRWLPYIRAKHNPDLVISEGASGVAIFVRLDKVASDKGAIEASDAAGVPW